MHSYQSAAPWRSCCILEAASGLQTLPALSGRRRYENVRQHLCRYSLLDCGCEENTDAFLLMWIHKIDSYGRSLTTFIFCIFKHMWYSYKPFGKRTCDGEAEHAATEDTEDRPSPADKESSSQFVPTDKPTDTWWSFFWMYWDTLKKSSSVVPPCLLLCQRHGVEKLWCYPVCIERAGWERAKAWETQEKLSKVTSQIITEL